MRGSVVKGMKICAYSRRRIRAKLTALIEDYSAGRKVVLKSLQHFNFLVTARSKPFYKFKLTACSGRGTTFSTAPA